MDIVQKIAQIGLPVVLVLTVIVVAIAVLDRHPHKKTRHDARHSGERHNHDADSS